MLVLRMLGVVLLVGLNSFFVAAEFALVAMRASRVQQLIEEGNARARIVKELLADMDRDRKSTRLNSSHLKLSRMPSSA